MRPEFYFGELTDWPVYAKTRQKEFNYPEGDANNYNTYEGSGGIRMGSFFRRLLLAFEMGDIAKVPFSNDITEDSVLIMRRNIVARVSALAPFLTLDNDPYLVVGEDGGLYWFIDAYTLSEQYPYARHIIADNRNVNYVRNSVKAVIDAYNGSVSFYVWDTTDPLIDAYQRMLPQLFKPSSAMPDFLRKHVRYPELLNMIQAQIYSTYHVENEQVFYNREDIWTVAQQGRSQGNQQTSDAIESFYVLMAFPGQSNLEFVSILPFTPANRNNLIGWLGARSDGDDTASCGDITSPKRDSWTGRFRYRRDRSKLTAVVAADAMEPAGVESDSRKSPCHSPGRSLLYVEPISPGRTSPMPELRLVVLLTQDRLAYASNFEDALKTLLEGNAAPSSPAPATSTANPSSKATTPPLAGDLRSLIDRANQALADYRRLTADGKLGEAGSKLDELKRTLEDLNRAHP